jgi:hypothetical protein
MKKAAATVVVLLALAGGGRAWAAEGPELAGLLVGQTLSAVAYVPWRPGLPGGGELARLMLQAYLRPDGAAEVRVWDPARDSYTEPEERRWNLSGSRLCIDLPTGQLCADVHIWGPRIAGIGQHPYAMLDGDLKPGNAISRSR